MKFTAFLASIMLLLAFTNPPKEDPKLQIEIRNIKKIEGHIMVAIYNDKEHYLDADYAIPAKAAVTQLGSMTISVEVPFGVYAIGVFHDQNDNGELDTNAMGIPNEPYGFSNGKKGTFGPPSFNGAKFEFKSDGQTHKIKL